MIQKKFDEYMENFKKLSLEEKQSIAIEQLKLLVSMAQEMCEVVDAKSEMIVNQELIDTNHESYTQDDFVEAVIVYINSIQNLLCDYNLKQ